MPIASPIGFLDVVNATLRASQVETTSRLTVANTAATKNFSVGDRFHVDKDSVDPVSVTGNVVASGIKISNLTISPIFDLGAVSNVGNTTSNTLQFANATTSFVASSNVEIGGNITLTSNAQVKVGSNVLAEYTGPHGRDPTTPLLKKYPEILFEEGKFDGNDSTNTYTQAGYTVTASDDRDDRKAWEVFDGISDGVTLNAWQTNSIFNTSTGLPTSSTETYTDTLPGGTNHVGVTLKLQLPKAIQISRIFMSAFDNTGSDDRSPKEGVFLGSTNGTSWELIKSFTESDLNYVSYNGDESSKVEATITGITNTSYYSYIVLIVKKIQVPNLYGVLNIKEIKYYGYEEPAPPGDLSLDTTLKSTFNSVRSNNYVMYFDGEDPDTGNVPKYLPSGSAKSITPNNVVFDATNNCWTLDGSTESNVTTGSLGFEGDAPHTVSTWINASNLEANATTQQLFSIGSGYSEEIVRVDDTQIAANTWHNVTYAYQGEGGSKVTYVDGRKVEEAQVEDTFGEYPPFAMTDYEVGGYRVSASSQYDADRAPWKAFDGLDSTSNPNRWVSGQGDIYDNGVYTGTESHIDVDGNTENGEWLKIEMPHKLKVGYFEIRANPTTGSQSFRDYAILGSNDDTNWYQVQKVSGLGVGNGLTGGSGGVGTDEVAIVPTGTYKNHAFKYFVFIWHNKANDVNGHVSMGELRLYGHKEGDLTRFPEPTRVLKYPHVAMTGPAQRGYVASASSEHSDSTFDGYNGIQEGKLFDDDSTTFWHTETNGTDDYRYDGTADAAGGRPYGAGSISNFDPTGINIPGEWVQLEFPHKLKISKVHIRARSTHENQAPKDFAFYGSDTGSAGSWTLIQSFTGETPQNDGTSYYAITSNPAHYKYILMLITRVVGTTAMSMATLQYYGTEEDTGTPTIVGGPFAGKVANFRVYDQYLGDERIQEIYDAQKDAFGHKKSSMTFYKGRVGVGTTEPEGALTVVDEPHALAKFPARAVSANDSYVEGDGQIKLSSAESSGEPVGTGDYSIGYGPSGYSGGSSFNAFDGITSTCWSSTPVRNTRLSEEVDFGAWLKIQTPESMSLKKAEIESKPDWMHVGGVLNDNAEYAALGTSAFGMDVDCSDDGTRVIIGAYNADEGGTDRGQAFVFDWNGYDWVQLGNTLQGTQNGELLGYAVAISGDGNYIAIGNPFYHDGSTADVGRYGVFYLAVATWTILPDSGSLTSTLQNYFLGTTTSELAGYSLSLSYDGKTISAGYRGSASGAGADAGQIRVHTYANGAWTQKGQNLNGLESGDRLGYSIDMSSDGNYLIAGSNYGANKQAYVYDYVSGSTSWVKRTTLSHPNPTDASSYGASVAISDDGNTVAVGAPYDDVDGTDFGRAYVYTWSGSAWSSPTILSNPGAATTADAFGSVVSISGDGTRLIVAASREDTAVHAQNTTDNGRVYTYEYYGGLWQLRQPVASIGATGLSDSARLGEFSDGCMISRDGSTIVVGEYAGICKARVFNMPSNIKSIWGSNDDVNWTKITTGNETFRGDDRLEFKNLDNPNYYKYHAIVADAFTQLRDVKLFGIRNQGSSTLHDGTLTLTKNLDVPRIGPPPDADDTPRRDRLVVEYNTHNNPLEDGLVQDTSGRGNDGVFYGGAVYDAAKKALVFDGTDDITEIDLGKEVFKNSSIHTTSLWVKMNRHTSDIQTFFSLGNGADFTAGVLKHANFFHSTNYGLRLSFTHHDYRLGEVAPIGQWVHVVYTYDGTTWQNTITPTNVNIYINGVKVAINSVYTVGGGPYTTNSILDLSVAQLALGAASTSSDTRDYSDVDISNFKLYDTVLTASEVKTLYDMGRCSNAIPKTLHIMGGMMRYNNDINRLQIHNGERWSTIGGIRASGGTRSTFGDYALHVFTESGTFSIENNEGGYVDILIVAGGGSGGGASNAGGGGAGGILLAYNYFLSGGAYTATVGAGAAATNATGGNGGDSSFSGINATAKGGGAGGEYRVDGGNGGNGGGAGADDRNVTRSGGGTTGSTPSGFTKYGNPGGGGINGTSTGRAGGGGGGAGGSGGQADGSTPGVGGKGINLSATFGTNVGESGYFASGGHGQSRSNTSRIYPGPLGGGGGNDHDRAGLPNTGGGSHGGVGGHLINPGGSGVIIVRYLV